MEPTPQKSFWKRPMVRNAWMVTLLLCGLFCLASSILLWASPAMFPTLTDRMKSVIDDRTQDKFTALTASLNKQTGWVHTPVNTVSVTQTDDTTAISTFAPITDAMDKGHSCYFKHRITGDIVELVYVIEVKKEHTTTTYSGVSVFVTLPAVVKCTAKGVPIAGNLTCLALGGSNTDTIVSTNKTALVTGALASSNDRSGQVKFDIGFPSAATVNRLHLTGNMTYQTL
jgi:hypothetical protein